MGLTREERETIIRYCEADDTITVDTGVPKHKRHMERLGFTGEEHRMPSKRDDNGKVTEWEACRWIFKGVPADHFKMPRPKKKVSEKQREAARERAKEIFGKG